MKISKTSIALLLIQLAIVSSVAAKYLYQRWTCPKVWTRAAAYDPELLMRGRYLSLQLTVDGCQSTCLPRRLPSCLTIPTERRWGRRSRFMRRKRSSSPLTSRSGTTSFWRFEMKVWKLETASTGSPWKLCQARPARPCASKIRWTSTLRNTPPTPRASNPVRNFGPNCPFRPKARRDPSSWRLETMGPGSHWRFSKLKSVRAFSECRD